MKQSAAQMTYSVVAGHTSMVKDRWGEKSQEYKKALIKLEEAKEELLLNGTPEEIALAKAEMAQEAAETTKVEEKEATTTKTPGFNCRIAIFFQSDKNGRKCAYYWSGRLGDGRAIRMKLAEAENLVAQGQADLLPCHPLKAATQEPEQVVEVAKPVLTDETITYTIVSRPTTNGIPFIARVLVPGQEVQEYDPQPSCWWMYTEGDLVNAVNKQFKGAWYLKPEVFEAQSTIEDETVPSYGQAQERQVVRVEKKSDFSMCGTSWFYAHPECFSIKKILQRDNTDGHRYTMLSHRDVGSRAVCCECGASIHEAPVQRQEETQHMEEQEEWTFTWEDWQSLTSHLDNDLEECNPEVFKKVNQIWVALTNSMSKDENIPIVVKMKNK